MTNLITTEELRKRFLQYTMKEKKLHAWCQEHGFHRANVGKYRSGQLPFSKTVALKFGYEKVVTVMWRKAKR